jgi:FMN reductase
MEAAGAAGAEIELFDVREMQLPMFDPQDREATPAVRRFCESTFLCDGMIWSTPLYHGTISGAFKNALDWLQLIGKREPPFLTDKVVGLIATAGGTQGLQAVNTMEFIVRALRGWAVPLVVPVAKARDAFDADGNVKDNQVRKQLEALGREVATAAARFAREAPLTTPEVAKLQAAEDQDLSSRP